MFTKLKLAATLGRKSSLPLDLKATLDHAPDGTVALHATRSAAFDAQGKKIRRMVAGESEQATRR